MKSRKLVLALVIVLVFAFATAVFAEGLVATRMNTHEQNIENCEECEGEPLQKRIRVREEQERMNGQKGMYRHQQRQSKLFGER